MPRVHPKIAHKEAQKILNNQSLLGHTDRKLVEQIREQVKTIQQQAQPLVQSRQQLLEAHSKHDQLLIDVTFTLESIKDVRQDLTEGYSDITHALNRLLSYAEDKILNLGDNIKTIDDLVEHFNLNADDINSEANKQKLIDRLIPLEADAQDKVNALEEKSDQLNEKQSKIKDQIDIYNTQIAELQNTLGVKLEIDSNFELTKISKGKKGPEFSVIFTNTEGKIHPYILYRGKEYEGKVRQLGEGGFGKVKLAQDYMTNELVAVKVQLTSHLPEHVLAKEKAILQKMEHFKGSAQRSEKDYIVQELHYGSELESLVIEGTLTDITFLNMLKQAAIKLQSMHDKNMIHRDIKLENFIWDNEMSKCVLIDFAFVADVNGDEIIHLRDEAGSQTYLSDEAANGDYSKRSDIYAFGIMMKEILEKHPVLNQQLKTDIDKLTMENVEERARSLTDVISKLSSLQVQVTQQKILPNRPAAITTQHHLLLKELRSKHQQQTQLEQDMGSTLSTKKKQ